MATAQFHRGDVVLVPFPFADLSGRKVRPAIVISSDPQGFEMILAFVTSVMSNRSPRKAEVELLKLDREFQVSGLKVDSLIRLDKVVTLSGNIVSRRLGKLGPKTVSQIDTMMRRAFGLQ